MTKKKLPAKPSKQSIRDYPQIGKKANGEFQAECDPDLDFTALMGTKTDDVARGIYISAISALGKSAEKYCSLMSAMAAEMEPRDAVEAMLIAQMTTTHVAMVTLSERMSYQTMYDVRESSERSMTRLSRTFIAQMDALKKYRSKAQQTVRVERVTVNEGGQAIVGDVTRKGEG